MADNITRYSASDGRRVEERTTEKLDDAGHKERVIETHVEQVPFSIEQRIVEKIVPIVTERRKEKYESGKLVDTVIEQVSNESLHLNPPANKVVTRDDVIEAVRLAFGEMSVSQKRMVRAAVVSEPEPAAVVIKPAVVTTAPNKWWQEWGSLALYVVLACETGFVVYQLFIRSFIERC